MAGIAPVSIDMRVGGMAGVRAAFSDVQSMLDKMARAGAKSATAGATARVRAEQSASRDISKEAQKTAKAQEQAAKEALKIRQQVNAIEVRDAQRAEAEKLRTVQQYARQHESIVQNSLRSEQRAREQAVREAENAEERIARSRASRANRAGSLIGGAVGRGVGIVGRVAGIAASIGGGFAIGDAIQAGVSQEAQAGRIVRGSVNSGGLSKQDVLNEARKTAVKTGGHATDVLGGLDAFVRTTGDLQKATELLGDLGNLAAATGTDMKDIGGMGGEVFAKLRIAGEEGQMMPTMRALAGQGRAGAIDPRDLAEYGGRLAGSALQFTGSAAKNIESFGAIAQLARQTGVAVDPAEATMAVERLSSDFTKGETAKRWQALLGGNGVYADAKHTKLRNAEDLITEGVSKTHGDIGALGGLFGERSIKAALGAQYVYAQAGGGRAGESAIRQQFNELKASALTPEDVDKGVKDRLAENEAKLNQASEQFQRAIQDKLLPVLPGLIEQFTRLIPAMTRAIDWLAQDAWHGIGGLVGAAITAEIVKAGISGIVSAGVTAAMKAALAGSAAANTAATATSTALAGAGVAAEGTAAGGGAAALGGGLTAGIAAAAVLPAAFLGYLGYRATKKEAAGEASASTALAMGEGTAEEQRAKLTSIRGLIGRAEDRQTATSAFNEGRESSLTGKQKDALQDVEAQGAAKHLAALKAEAESLTNTLAKLNATAENGDLGRGDKNDPSRHPASD